MGRSGRDDVDLDALVPASETLTPADIDYAARKAAESAFDFSSSAPVEADSNNIHRFGRSLGILRGQYC